MKSVRRAVSNSLPWAGTLDRLFAWLNAGSASHLARAITGYAIVAANLIAFLIVMILTESVTAFAAPPAVVFGVVPIATTLTTALVAYPVVRYCVMLVQTLNRARQELRQAVERAEQATASRQRFLANTSHELRTPLNGVLSMAELVLERPLDPDQRERVEILRDSGQALAGILNDLLDLSKIDAGRLDISPEPADLTLALQRLSQLWRAQTDKKGITLMLDIASDVPRYLLLDLGRVRQCVANLVSNAIKFTDRGRVSVEVAVDPLPGGRLMLQVDVADTGPGIPREKLDRLFRPFVQVDDSAARRQGGTGLGLAITRQLAQLMGGDVRAISAPGLGSRFSLSLPVDPAAPPPGDAAATDAPAQDTPPPTATILVVDDNSVNRMVVQHFLASDGHRVIEADSGARALALLAAQPVDLVLLDIHMPGLDGPETLAAIRASGQAWAGVAAIALTADAVGGDRERYLAMGMADYLSKPIDQVLLRRSVRAALAARHGG